MQELDLVPLDPLDEMQQFSTLRRMESEIDQLLSLESTMRTVLLASMEADLMRQSIAVQRAMISIERLAAAGALDSLKLNATPEHVLEALPVVAIKKDSDEEHASQACSICLTNYFGEEKATSSCDGTEEGEVETVRVLKLPCSHYFHCECATEWLRRQHTCPLCRQCVCEGITDFRRFTANANTLTRSAVSTQTPPATAVTAVAASTQTSNGGPPMTATAAAAELADLLREDFQLENRSDDPMAVEDRRQRRIARRNRQRLRTTNSYTYSPGEERLTSVPSTGTNSSGNSNSSNHSIGSITRLSTPTRALVSNGGTSATASYSLHPAANATASRTNWLRGSNQRANSMQQRRGIAAPVQYVNLMAERRREAERGDLPRVGHLASDAGVEAVRARTNIGIEAMRGGSGDGGGSDSDANGNAGGTTATTTAARWGSDQHRQADASPTAMRSRVAMAVARQRLNRRIESQGASGSTQGTSTNAPTPAAAVAHIAGGAAAYANTHRRMRMAGQVLQRQQLAPAPVQTPRIRASAFNTRRAPR
jgi:hypothetical protein